MNTHQLTTLLKDAARELGFPLVGICAAVQPGGIHHLHDWLNAGYAGEMSYIANRLDAYADPNLVLDGARSIVMLGMPYSSARVRSPKIGEGLIAKYASGEIDYHDLIHDRLKLLIARLREFAPEINARGVVDSAPLMEREFAQLAGLGWTGKNTLLLNRERGSLFFLAAVLIDAELDYDESFTADHCGSCTACLDACPTDAFPQPYVLDATKCISYLTIELRDAVPDALRPGIGDWLFGCDICQDVCPWNRHATDTTEPMLKAIPDRSPIYLPQLFHLSDEQFRQMFRRTPLWRSKRRGILRNAAIVLGNQKSSDAIEPLTIGLADTEPIVRGASAWALSQVGGDVAIAALQKAKESETEESVRAEIDNALSSA